MVEDTLMQARQLIQEKRYSEARSLLYGLDHPKAQEWIARIDELTAPPAADPFMSAPTVTAPRPQSAYDSSPVESFPVDPEMNGGSASVRPSSGISLFGALIGGVVGALLGAAIWAAIMYFVEREIGYAALGVGFLTGFFAVLFSGGRRGIPVQLIAVVLALVGIAVGKYAGFYALAIRDVTAEFGQDMASEVFTRFPPLSGETAQFIFEDIQANLQPVDIAFVAFAILAAWAIASNNRGRSRKLAAA